MNKALKQQLKDELKRFTGRIDTQGYGLMVDGRFMSTFDEFWENVDMLTYDDFYMIVSIIIKHFSDDIEMLHVLLDDLCFYTLVTFGFDAGVKKIQECTLWYS